jgi:alkylhydroperoxidase family enzyme
LAAGADEQLWDAIDGPDPRLSAQHRAAVALTDGMIWTPGRLDAALVADVRTEFSPVQAVELVLDVMRNAANKIAVSLGADQARVSEGTEVYEIDAHGVTHYGVEPV